MYTGKIVFGVKTPQGEIPRTDIVSLELLSPDQIRLETLNASDPLTRKELIELLNEILDYLET